METKKRRVIRTPESYRKEVSGITNGEYSVVGDFIKVMTKIRHIHNECGFEWDINPRDFISAGVRCPICFNHRKLRTAESYRQEVSELTNGEYLVVGDFVKMKTKIPHVHVVCGCEWEVSPNNFINNGSKCPKCSGVASPSNVEFKKRVYALVGDEYVFMEPYLTSMSKIEVKHAFCGHRYSVTPLNFLNGRRCPNCVYSRGEKVVADVLDSLSIEYTREHTFEYLGLKRYDFFIPSLNIAIEYDGEQHFEARDFFGGEEALKRTQESDALKNDFCEYVGIDLLRIPYWEFDNIDEIVTNFVDTVKLMRSISDSSIEIAKCR